jgi:N-acyl-D-amino-acid deacylase
MKRDLLESQGDIKFAVKWTTLGEYLEYLGRKGVSTNVASFVGAATVRIYALGYQDRAPTYIELQKMQQLVAQAMREGALGISSALIYAPGVYAKTDELEALAEVAGKYGGIYISHLRSEGNDLLEAVDELITIARKD